MKSSELMEIGKVVIQKNQINKIPLSCELAASVPSEIGPELPLAPQVLRSFFRWGLC